MKVLIVMCVLATAVAKPIFDDDDVNFFVRSPEPRIDIHHPFFRSSGYGVGAVQASPYFKVDDDVRAFVTPVHTETVRKVDKLDKVSTVPVDVKPYEYDTTFYSAGNERVPVVKKTYKQPVVYKQYFYYD